MEPEKYKARRCAKIEVEIMGINFTAPGTYIEVQSFRQAHTLEFYPPAGVDITPFLPEEEPERQQTLYEIGIKNILNGISIQNLYGVNSGNNSFEVVFSSWLKKQLNYNQTYMLGCNCLSVSQNLIGMVINWNEIERYSQSLFHKVISCLISVEKWPGDFGQDFDFRTAITPNDFVLNEYDY